MKKIVLSTICMIVLLGLVGCGKPSKSKDVMEYLNEEYPGETFEIISKNSIELENSTCGDDTVLGNKWEIRSKTTNIEFIVSDDYDFNSFVCEFVLRDNYKLQTVKKYVYDYNDTRIIVNDKGYGDYVNIKVNYEDFSSSIELANVLYNFKVFYENKPSRKNVNVSVDILKAGEYVGYFRIMYADKNITLSDIQNNIEEIINK